MLPPANTHTSLQEVPRALPREWHLVAPQNVNLAGAALPLPLGGGNGDGNSHSGDSAGASDAAVAAFLERAAADGAPVVYVCAGTIVEPTAAELATIVDGIRGVPGARWLWSLKESCHALLPPDVNPATVRDGGAKAPSPPALVVAWAPQQALLTHPAVRLFVTHGGLNSMHEGLAAGKPLLVLPYFADQPVNAKHVAERGLGAALDPARLTGPALARAVASLLADGGAAARAAALGARMRARNGADEAARVVRGFAAGAIEGRRGSEPGRCHAGAGADDERCCAEGAAAGAVGALQWLPGGRAPLCCEDHALAHAALQLAYCAVLVVLVLCALRDAGSTFAALRRLLLAATGASL